MPDALKEIARELTPDATTRINVSTEGEPRPLKDLLANNLFHAGQEAMTMAIAPPGGCRQRKRAISQMLMATAQAMASQGTLSQ